MSLKGWAIAFLLSPFTLGLSIPVYFWIWFLGKIGSFYIKAMTFMIKATIGIIAWPFKAVASALGGTFHFFELMYYQGTHNIKKDENTEYNRRGYGNGAQQQGGNQNQEAQEESGGALETAKSGVSFIFRYKLRYVALFLGIIFLFNYPSTVLALVQNPSEILTVSGFIDFIPTLLFISIPFLITIFASSLAYEFLGDGVVFWKATQDAVNQAKHIGKGPVAAAGGAAAAGKAAAESGMNVGEAAETAVTTASHIDTARGMIGGEAAAGEAAAGEAAAGEAAAAETGLAGLLEGSALAGAASSAVPVIVALIAAWIFYTLIAGFISLILVGITWFYIAQALPLIAGPVLGALGLGAAYGDWLGSEAANSEAGMTLLQGDIFSEEKRAVSQAFAKVGCMAKGPQCLRQWQMNNTVRPGSEARGETYELQISQFSLGTESVDVAYKESDYTLPVNFLVENTRNGLKGINARNVSYKISVKDSEETYCTTGWKKINTSTGNYILPGLGVSPTRSLEELNLGNCGLLQPSLGVNRVMELQAKYNYASQATLYADAMSREHRREQGIEPGFKKSETAKTPVQSYVNVRSPISFYETESGERNAVPFGARFGFETPGFSSRYKIKPDSIQIADSSVTTHTDTCNGLKPDEDMGENYYEISDRAEQRIQKRQQNSWFSADVEPAPLRCTMKIEEEDLGQISPTGEQLIMRIDGNYTIVKEDEMTGFDVKNTLCTRKTCPMLVTQEYAEQSDYELYSECTSGNSVDARGGCSVRMPNSSGGDLSWSLPNLAQRNDEDVEIEQGKIVRRLGSFLGNPNLGLPGTVKANNTNRGQGQTWVEELRSDGGAYSSGSPVPVGVPKQEDVRSELGDAQGAVLYEKTSNLNNVGVAGLEKALCQENGEYSPDYSNDQEAAKQYMSQWTSESRADGNPLKISVNTVSCQESISEKILDFYSCEFDLLGETAVTYGEYSTWLYTGDAPDPELPDSCSDVTTDTQDQAISCDGVLVKESGRNNVECYGGELPN